MSWRGVAAVVRRDLQVAMGSKAVVLPAIIVPALLVVLLPALAGLAPSLVDASSAGDIERFLAALPGSALEGIPTDPGLQTAYVLVVYMLSPLVLIIPVMFSSVIAADGLAGEKERGTLEALLLTPLTDRELAVAKLLAAWIPATVLGLGGAVLYAVVANVAVGLQLDRLILPTWEFALLALWVGPTFAATSLGAVSLVSVRVSTTQEAFQVGGVVVLPVVAMVVSQASGALLLSGWVLVVAGLVAVAAAAGLLRAAATALSRGRLGPRLG